MLSPRPIGFIDHARVARQAQATIQSAQTRPQAQTSQPEAPDTLLRFDGGESVSFLDASHNTMALGTTGSGKTASILLPAFDRLCAAGCGGVIIDSKGSLAPIVRAIAARHGRVADVVEAGPYEGSKPFNLLAGMTAGEARDVLESLLLGYCSSDREGTFWHRTGLQQLLDAYAVVHDLCRQTGVPFGLHLPVRMLQEPQYALKVFSRWKASLAPDDRAGHDLLARIEASSAHIIPKTAKIMDSKIWQEQTTYYGSAVRTGLGILQQTPGILSRFFAPDGAPFSAERFVFDEGRILLLRLSPDSGEAGAGLARILLKSFYGAVFRRGLGLPAGQYVFCIADEWQDYVSTSPLDALNDASFLAKCREFRCVFIAGTQSAVALSQRAAHGLDDVRAMSANFNIRVFLYNDDPETQRLAGAAAEDVRLHELEPGQCLLVHYDAGTRRHEAGVTSANGMYDALAPVIASAVRRQDRLAATDPDVAQKEREMQDMLVAIPPEEVDAGYLDAVRQDGMALKRVPEALKTPELCMVAVTACGWALCFVPESLKTPEICLAAVRQDGMALERVPERQMTPEICAEAVRQNGAALGYVPDSLKTEDLCLEAVRRQAWMLEDVPAPLKTAELCMEAVRHDGTALRSVPDALKEPDLCMAAMRQDWRALEFVPEALKSPEICAEAVRQDGMALKWIPEALETPELCKEAVQQNGLALKFVPERLRTPALCMEAVQKDGMALKFVPERLRTPELCLAAVRQNVLAVRYVPEQPPSGGPAERSPRRLTPLCLRRGRSGRHACAER